MHIIQEDTTLVALSELRTKPKDILKAMGHSKVVVERRNRPFAVLVPIEQYNKMEEIPEMVEERALGYAAVAREKKARRRDYLTLEAAEKKVGLR